MNPLIQWHQRGQKLIQLGLNQQALIKEFSPTNLCDIALGTRRQIKKILPQIQVQGQLLYGHIDLIKGNENYSPIIIEYLDWINQEREQSSLIYPHPPFEVRMHSSFCVNYLLRGNMYTHRLQLFGSKLRIIVTTGHVFNVYWKRERRDILSFLEKAKELGVLS